MHLTKKAEELTYLSIIIAASTFTLVYHLEVRLGKAEQASWVKMMLPRGKLIALAPSADHKY
jgi:hypothetical protein